MYRRTVFRVLVAVPAALLGGIATVRSGAAPVAPSVTRMWQVVPTASGLRDVARYGITALSPRDIWTVGAVHGIDGVIRPYTEHWDGDTWQEMATPGPMGLQSPRPMNVGGGGGYAGDVLRLNAVAGTAADDVWAVGNDQQGDTHHALIMHWNGAQWETAPVPQSLDTFRVSLEAVVALAHDDAWAVGTYETPGDRRDATAPLTLHWDGAQWEMTPTPSAPAPDGTPAAIRGQLRAVSATARDDVWAVGAQTTGGNASSPLILHWNGARWDLAPAPGAGGVVGELRGVSDNGRGDAWAVGVPDAGKQPLVLRGNGAAWQTITVPDVPGSLARLVAVAALAPDDVWAVGSSSTFKLIEDIYQEKAKLVVYHWDGAAWVTVFPPVPDFRVVFGSGGPTALAVASPTDIWVLGEFEDARYLRYTAPSP